MNRRRLAATVALLAVAVALAAAVVLGDASLALWTAVAVGAAALAAGGIVLYAGLGRLSLLVRYLATRPMDVDAAADLASGTGWFRIVGEVAGPREVTSVHSGEDVVGRTLGLERRTHPFALKWPGVDRRTIGEETEIGRIALLGRSDRIRFESDETVTIAAPTARISFGADHEPGYELIQALQRHDRSFGSVVGAGRFGPHRLHVSEATLEPGQRAQLFGLVSVAADGGPPTLRPAEGRGGTTAIAVGHRLPLRYLRGAVAGVAGAAVLLSLAWFVLGPILR